MPYRRSPAHRGMSVRTCVLVSLLAAGVSEWVQLPVLERRDDHPQAPAWPGKYFNQAANQPRRVVTTPTPPAASRGTSKPPGRGASASAATTNRPTTRQHPVLMLAYNGETPRVQFVRPAIFVWNHTAATTAGPDPDDVRQAKGVEGGGAGLLESPLDVLRKVHQSLKMQTPRSVLAKLKFLHDLKENLLFYVGQYPPWLLAQPHHSVYHVVRL